jgi:hypothetical protein
MESGALGDSAAANAADSARDAFGFVIPVARSLSDSDEESEVSEKESPSQYRKAQMLEQGSGGSDDESSDQEVEMAKDEIQPDDLVDGLSMFHVLFSTRKPH